MKIFYSKYLPPKGFGAINIFGLIIVRKDYGKLTEVEMNHERIHSRQICEMLVVLFYLIYSLEWVIRLIQFADRKKAYYNISFEREAYANMDNLSYLENRKPYSFIKYFRRN